jgi:hypothetical protein
MVMCRCELDDEPLVTCVTDACATPHPPDCTLRSRSPPSPRPHH